MSTRTCPQGQGPSLQEQGLCIQPTRLHMIASFSGHWTGNINASNTQHPAVIIMHNVSPWIASQQCWIWKLHYFMRRLYTVSKIATFLFLELLSQKAKICEGLEPQGQRQGLAISAWESLNASVLERPWIPVSLRVLECQCFWEDAFFDV